MTTGHVIAQMRKPSDTWVGTVSSADPLTVRYDSADVPCTQVGAWSPVVGHLVFVQERAGTAYALGYVWPWPRPQTVTVTNVDATTPDANGDPVLLPGHLTAQDGAGREYKIRYVPTYSPTAGDEVRVSWDTPAGLVLALVSAQAPAPVPPGTVGSGETGGRDYFSAIDGGSFRGGKWRTDTNTVTQGDYGGYGNNAGAFFYGGAFQMLAGATVIGARVRVNRVRGGAGYSGGESLHIYRHTSASRPAGDVARASGPYTVSVPLGLGWYSLDLAMAQTLVDSGGGLAIYDPTANDYINLAGLPSDRESMQVEITWTRT